MKYLSTLYSNWHHTHTRTQSCSPSSSLFVVWWGVVSFPQTRSGSCWELRTLSLTADFPAGHSLTGLPAHWCWCGINQIRANGISSTAAETDTHWVFVWEDEKRQRDQIICRGVGCCYFARTRYGVLQMSLTWPLLDPISILTDRQTDNRLVNFALQWCLDL